MDQSSEIKQIIAALIKAQKMMNPATRDKINPHFKSTYATLESVIEAIKGPCNENGITVTQLTGFDANGTFVVNTQITHQSGEWMRGAYPVIGRDNSPQTTGAALTYAKRFALCAAFLLPTEDDDGNKAEGRPEKVSSPKETYSEQEPPPWIPADEFEAPTSPLQKRNWDLKPPTEKQMKFLNDLLVKNKWSDERLSDFLKSKFNRGSKEELDSQQIKTMIDTLLGKIK